MWASRVINPKLSDVITSCRQRAGDNRGAVVRELDSSNGAVCQLERSDGAVGEGDGDFVARDAACIDEGNTLLN